MIKSWGIHYCQGQKSWKLPGPLGPLSWVCHDPVSQNGIFFVVYGPRGEINLATSSYVVSCTSFFHRVHNANPCKNFQGHSYFPSTWWKCNGSQKLCPNIFWPEVPGVYLRRVMGERNERGLTTCLGPVQLHSTAVWLMALALRLGGAGLVPLVTTCAKDKGLSPSSVLAQAEISYGVWAVKLATEQKERFEPLD